MPKYAVLSNENIKEFEADRVRVMNGNLHLFNLAPTHSDDITVAYFAAGHWACVQLSEQTPALVDPKLANNSSPDRKITPAHDPKVTPSAYGEEW